MSDNTLPETILTEVPLPATIEREGRTPHPTRRDKMLTVNVVVSNEYLGTCCKFERHLPDAATPKEIWTELSQGERDEEPNTSSREGYLEDWDACGSHHKGVIVQAWWGENAKGKAEQRLQELLAAGAQPE